VDLAPGEIHAILLDEGSYLCLESTMYRLLREHGEVRERRRRQATHPARVKPELVAHGPNQCWPWDITKLAGPVRWTYYYLYSIIDIYSRYTVGWMVATCESAALVERLLAETITKQAVQRDQLTIHADNGSSMASKPVAFLLADLGVTRSHSGPRSPTSAMIGYMPSRVGPDPSQRPASCLRVDLSARSRDGARPTGQASSDLIGAWPIDTVAVLSARLSGGDHHHRYDGGDSHHQHAATPTRRLDRPDRPDRRCIIGVDTHKDIHVAVAIDQLGVRLEELHVPTTTAGYTRLRCWANELGSVEAFGVEGTGSYGAGLAAT